MLSLLFHTNLSLPDSASLLLTNYFQLFFLHKTELFPDFPCIYQEETYDVPMECEKSIVTQIRQQAADDFQMSLIHQPLSDKSLLLDTFHKSNAYISNSLARTILYLEKYPSSQY